MMNADTRDIIKRPIRILFVNDHLGLPGDRSTTYLTNTLPAFGYVALEAMCAQRPVVASNVGGLGEVLDHGKRGVLVDMHDIDNVVAVCEKLITYPELIESPVARAWEFASKLTINEHLRQLCEVYDDILLNSPTQNLYNSNHCCPVNS